MKVTPLLVLRADTNSCMPARPLALEQGSFVLAGKRGVLGLLLVRQSSVCHVGMTLLVLWEELKPLGGQKSFPLASLPSDVER